MDLEELNKIRETIYEFTMTLSFNEDIDRASPRLLKLKNRAIDTLTALECELLDAINELEEGGSEEEVGYA